MLAGCSNYSDIDSVSEPEDEIPSYQPIKKPTEITAKNQRNGENKKRKAEPENLYSLEANIKITEESIKKLQTHLNNKTCPKSLRYNARANIPPVEQFKKDIHTLKQKAEHGFLSALTRFNYRHLEKQKIKFRKEKGKTLRKGTPERRRHQC